MTTIDLNCDLGEGTVAEGMTADQLDDALLEVITSANVACGGHAGDLHSMARICARARDLGVSIGAQISYVDRAGFGRRPLDIAPDLLTEQLHEQITALTACAGAVGTDVHYVKPHGALYNAAADDEVIAMSVVRSILRDADERGHALPVLTLPGCELAHAASQHGITTYREGFADRAYTDNGRLVPRSEPNAVIESQHAVHARVLNLIENQRLVSVTGTDMAIEVDSICVHSDTPGALALVRNLRHACELAGIELRPFVRSVRG